MAWRDDRLRDVLAVKELDPAKFHHKTKLPYPQIGRYTAPRGQAGFGKPNIETLAAIAIGLEIDADFLLDSDPRYDAMTTRQAVAHMSLDRYVNEETNGERPVTYDEQTSLRLVASNHSRPPMWSEEWRREHESIRLRELAATPSGKSSQKPAS